MEQTTMEGPTSETTATRIGSGISETRTATPVEGEFIERTHTRFPWISWGGIFAGLIAGLGAYILLTLLGLAWGLTAINPQAARPVGGVPLATAVWSVIALILSGFVGGYVAARASGFSRVADGILHGLVAWGASVLVLALLVTSSIGAVLGGAMSIIGQSASALTGGVVMTAGGAAGRGGTAELERMIKGSTGGRAMSATAMRNLQDRLSAGDRNGAIDVMVGQMGFTRDRATRLVDPALRLYTRGPAQARATAAAAVTDLSRITWGAFAGVLLALVLSIAGGVAGSKGATKRRRPLTTAAAH